MRDVILLLEREALVLANMGVKLSEITVSSLNDILGSGYKVRERTRQSTSPGGLLAKLGYMDTSVVIDASDVVSNVKSTASIDCAINDSTIIIWEDSGVTSGIGNSVLQSNLAKIIKTLSSIDGLGKSLASKQMSLYLSMN